MGDEFTPEEKVILGEVDPDPQTAAPDKPPEEGAKPDGEANPPADGTKPPESDKPEHTEEEKAAAEKDGARVEVDAKGKTWVVDDEGTRIPLTRWRKIYHEKMDAVRGKEETERKHKLFKELGQDKYYELYPDEAPADYKPAQQARPGQQWPGVNPNMGEMLVKGGDYDGMTLNQVWQENPAYANFLQNQYIESVRTAETRYRERHDTLVKEATTEVEQFSVSVAKELFNKELSGLTPQEEQKIAETIQQTLDFMKKTGRGGGILADAYFIMNKENLITEARTKGGQAALQSLTKPSVPSINASGGGAVTGMNAYEAMSRDELAAKIADMNDTQLSRFMKEATPALKQKHPDLPWT